MQYLVKRYNFEMELIEQGYLIIEEDKHSTVLRYSNSEIDITVSEPYHPMTALDNLRQQLETNCRSILAINGCRIDTARQTSGSYMTYIMNEGQPATIQIDMFEPTENIDKLCTLEIHEAAYDIWLRTLGFD